MGTTKEATNIIQKICTHLGENNHPTYAVMAIALCKGILRPTFTMRDKKQDPQTKKYAAFREGVTEVVAFPSYFIFGTLANKLAPKFLDKKIIKDANNNPITKEQIEKFDKIFDLKHNLKKQKIDSSEIKTQVNDAIQKLGNSEKALFKSYDKALKVVGETTSFVGVCAAALLFIPAMCNVVLPPVMKTFQKIQDGKKPATEVAKSQPIAPVTAKPEINKTLSTSNMVNMYLNSNAKSGMRVGN